MMILFDLCAPPRSCCDSSGECAPRLLPRQSRTAAGDHGARSGAAESTLVIDRLTPRGWDERLLAHLQPTSRRRTRTSSARC